MSKPIKTEALCPRCTSTGLFREWIDWANRNPVQDAQVVCQACLHEWVATIRRPGFGVLKRRPHDGSTDPRKQTPEGS